MISSMAKGEVLSGQERRRRWAPAGKERLVGLSLEPGASASEIARSAGLHVSQLFRWRKQLCERIAPEAPALLPVMVEPPLDEPAIAAQHSPPRKRRACREGRVEIELASGDRVRLEGGVDGRALREVLAALRAR